MKIETIALTDFRAFAGPSAATFQLSGKNLLVFGENGSGKSSLFYALKAFFHPIEKPIAPYKNRFTQGNGGICSVKIVFSDSTIAAWTGNSRNVLPASKKADIFGASLRAAALDYRAILDTSYLHNFESKPHLTAADDPFSLRPLRRINLFKVAVDTLLGGFLVTPPSGAGVTQTTIRQLWRAVEQQTRSIGRNAASSHPDVNKVCVEFNHGLNTALQQMNPFLQPLLDALGYSDLLVRNLSFGGLTPISSGLRNNRYFGGQELWLDVEFRGINPDEPQNFLNEARLSALGLAIYLAGRLALVQSAPLDALKLLVLDDVLIGLDQSNRIPVLDVLEQQFMGWQIVLLTHDRLWFETARIRANLSGAWNIVELYANHEEDAHYQPLVMAGKSDVVNEYLDRADRHLLASDWRACAVYARSAFEMWLKLQCAKNDVPIRFSLEPRKLDSNVYFNALEGWAANNHMKAALAGTINILSLYRDTVFNPGSHSYPTSMSGGELRAALKAMRFVNEASKHGKTAINIAQSLIKKNGVTPEELALAAGYLRVAFIGRLRGLACGKHLGLPFSMAPHEFSPANLWNAMSATWPPKRATWVAGINANAPVLLDNWTWPILLTMTAPQLQTAIDAVKRH